MYDDGFNDDGVLKPIKHARADDPMSQVHELHGPDRPGRAEGRRHPQHGDRQVQLDGEYPKTSIASSLKGIAQVKLAGLGTRVFYTAHGSFDTHANQLATHALLWKDVSEAVAAFFADLRAHDEADDVIMLLWTEFGRRVKDNGAGTDHGAGGVAVRDRRAGQGRHVRRVPVAEGGRPDDRQPEVQQRLPLDLRHDPGEAGSRSTRSRSSTAASSSSRSSNEQ